MDRTLQQILQQLIDLVRENEQLRETNQQLQAKLAELQPKE
jgi:regulator of replication initiation timing